MNGRRIALLTLGILACVDTPTGLGEHEPATVRVELVLPDATPAVWSAVGETLHVEVRRAGRVQPIVDTAFVVTEALAVTLTVPLAYARERFVAAADVRYGASLLFIGFDAVEFRAGVDTALTLIASYVGPGAKTASFELMAPDSSLLRDDTTRLIRVARDSTGQMIPNVPARFVAARLDVVAVDTAGLLTAVVDANDTARVTGFLPTGHRGDMLMRVERNLSGIVAQVSVSPEAALLRAAGEQAQFTATASDIYGAAVESAPFTWESTNPAVATVDNGLATAVSAGTTMVIAASNGIADSALVTVELPTPEPPPPGGPDPTVRTWVGGDASAPTDWSRDGNWNPTGVPNALDTVVIVSAANPPSLSTNATVARVRVRSGNLTLNGHTLTVNGDFSTEDSAGTITMLHPADTLRVQGTALFAGGSTSGLLNEGVVLIGGDFEQRVSTDNVDAFRAEGNNQVVFNGAALQLLRAQSGVEFVHVEIANTGGVRAELQEQVEIEGHLRISTAVELQVVGPGFDVGDSIVTVTGSSIVAPHLELSGGMSVAGAFQVDTVRFDGEGHGVQPGLPYQHVIVSDSVHLTGATAVSGSLVIIDGGQVTLNGQTLTTATLNVGGDPDQGLREALLHMLSPADAVIVTDSAVFDSDTSGTMSGGTLFIARNLRIRRHGSFVASGTHRVVPNGAGAQQLQIAPGARLNTLDILNASGPVTIISPDEAAGLVELNGKLAIRSAITVDATQAAFDVADSIVTASGSTLSTAGLTLRGAIALGGAFTSGLTQFAGVDQDVPAHGVYSGEVTVSGQARLVAPTSFGGFVLVRGPQSRLTLNGQRLLVGGSFSVGGVGVPEGTVTMTNAGDSLVVAGDVVFWGGSSAGLLSAGTVVAGGGFFIGEDPAAFQPTGTHRVVLNGAAQQVVDVEPSAVASAFNHLELAKTGGGVWLRSPVRVAGTLSTGLAGQQISGTSHHLLTVGGVDASRLTLDTIPLSIQSGALTRLDSVTFARQSRSIAQLSIAHPGAATAFTVTGLQFLSTPTTGFYVSAEDNASSDANVLTIRITQSTPDDGSARTQTSGGAIVQWDGGFAATGNMVGGRFSHAAALLADGRVLVAGGRSGPGSTASANLYTPATGTFASTGSLNRTRFDLAATSLVDGRVLIVGGDATILPNATEAYDPATGTFSIPDTLGANPGCQGRVAPTATRLADGRVLIAGGMGRATPNLVNACWPVISEIFDPATNAISETGVLVSGRFRHSATLLPDGRVLVTGGWDASNFVTPVSEIFDPGTGTFTRTDSLAIARASHTATLMNDGRVLIVGGDLGATDQTVVEIYDPATGTFSLTGSLSTGRTGHVAFRLADGRVLVAGGNGSGGPSATYEVYDPATGTFSAPAPLVAARWLSAGVILLDGRVLITGSSTLTGAASNTAEVFQP